MPSGGNTPIDGKTWERVRADYDVAVAHGLQYEWLQWMIGGIVHNKKNPAEASYDACIEWDF
jgi:hypothetical protein